MINFIRKIEKSVKFFVRQDDIRMREAFNMAGPILTPIIYAFRRVPGINRGEQILWGLSSLARKIRGEFWRGKEAEIRLDFENGRAGENISISNAICVAMERKGIKGLTVRLGKNIPSMEKLDFPSQTLKAAINMRPARAGDERDSFGADKIGFIVCRLSR